MKFGYVIQYVPSVPATLAFYEAAFGFQRKFMTPEEDYAELVSGETTLAFASLALGNSNFSRGFTTSQTDQAPFGVEMAFTTEQIEADFQRAIDAGATVYEPLQQKPWGQQVGYLRDLNGFLIELCTPMG